MATKEKIQQRFDELANINMIASSYNGKIADDKTWAGWSSSALNLIQIVFGADSSHYSRLKSVITKKNAAYLDTDYPEALGVLLAAKTDYEKDCYGSLERRVSGEVFGDFIVAAENALAEGNKDVAAVLACAALEDALKRFANANGLNVDGKDMSVVIGALKSKSLVGGAQKSILETMPKTRNAAMHADWTKVSATEVGGVIGFTKQFLLENF
jgi:hypothetical protein